MNIDEIECAEQTGTMSIWLDAHMPEMHPSLGINIKAETQPVRINGESCIGAPSIHCGCDLDIPNWESLTGMRFSGKCGGKNSAQFNAWILNPQMVDTEKFSVNILDREADFFTVECDAEVYIHDFGSRSHLVHFYDLSCIPFLGINVGIPKESKQVGEDAKALVSKHFEITNLERPVISERRINSSAPIVAYEVHFSPLIEA